MITRIESEKLVVISDLHLGNPFSQAKKKTVEFLRWAASKGYDVCINGDGLEIAQVSFRKIARDVPEVFQALKAVARQGRTTYYVVGNHDIALENFLEDWGSFKVTPFLNVISGDRRIRIEHGHLYDPFFVLNPRLYEIATWAGGLFLNISPNLYRLWIAFERGRSLMRGKGQSGIVGEHPDFSIAAQEILQRGFDAVVFGHTHHAGSIQYGENKTYFNSGSWLLQCNYVEIVNGQLTLKNWADVF